MRRRLPLIDRIEVSVIEEAQPRWLAFVGGKIVRHLIRHPFKAGWGHFTDIVREL